MSNKTLNEKRCLIYFRKAEKAKHKNIGILFAVGVFDGKAEGYPRKY